MEIEDEEIWLKPCEVARLFRVGASTVSRWGREGLMGAGKTPGGHYRFPESEVRRLLAGRTGENT